MKLIKCVHFFNNVIIPFTLAYRKKISFTLVDDFCSVQNETQLKGQRKQGRIITFKVLHNIETNLC